MMNVKVFYVLELKTSKQNFVLPSVCLYVRPPVRPSVHSSICLYACPSIHPSVHLSARPSVRMSVCIYVCMYVYLSVRPVRSLLFQMQISKCKNEYQKSQLKISNLKTKIQNLINNYKFNIENSKRKIQNTNFARTQAHTYF